MSIIRSLLALLVRISHGRRRETQAGGNSAELPKPQLVRLPAPIPSLVMPVDDAAFLATLEKAQHDIMMQYAIPKHVFLGTPLADAGTIKKVWDDAFSKPVESPVNRDTASLEAFAHNAKDIAKLLRTMPEDQRKRELDAINHANPCMHVVVKAELDKVSVPTPMNPQPPKPAAVAANPLPRKGRLSGVATRYIDGRHRPGVICTTCLCLYPQVDGAIRDQGHVIIECPKCCPPKAPEPPAKTGNLVVHMEGAVRYLQCVDCHYNYPESKGLAVTYAGYVTHCPKCHTDPVAKLVAAPAGSEAMPAKTGRLVFNCSKKLGLDGPYDWFHCVDCDCSFPKIDGVISSNRTAISLCPYCRPDSKPFFAGRGN